jgi:mono/diheme cytochrome c family protein
MKTKFLIAIASAIALAACGAEKPAPAAPPPEAPAVPEAAAIPPTSDSTPPAAQPAPGTRPAAAPAQPPAAVPPVIKPEPPPVQPPATEPVTAPKSAPVAAAPSAPTVDPLTGKPLYDAQCKKCHGVSGVPPKVIATKFPKLVPLDAAYLARTTDDAIVAIMVNGKGDDMKSFKDKLSHAEMVAVAAYIRTFGPKP